MSTDASSPIRPQPYQLNAALRVILWAGVVLAAFLLVRQLQIMLTYEFNQIGGIVMLAHSGVALVASLLTAWMLIGPKGTQVHRWMGRIWSVMLVFIAVSSFWLRDGFGAAMGWPLGLGPIHILSAVTVFSVTQGILAIRKGNLKVHISNMVTVCWALLIAGAFTLLPGRFMQQLAFFLI
ncbi:DUF2306 domain-containing protein [Natronospirillum operosum]|uniref:DUF2306 domain-containing protein n=1 Tax=Natronospirillum operosum TaxID=2759953 RepID=A0A4Z0W824_9GAMM|nr:DUF2306 domain-containing protein [Natronospirillum operosum]TGG91779.1 DUF2306 domain-containing protein [Natronospirillum operosum]